jgi:hypothetical protein
VTVSNCRAHAGDLLRIELLTLSTTILRIAPNVLAPYKQDIVKYAWSHVKNVEAYYRSHALLNIATFLRTYTAPEKIYMQVQGKATGGPVGSRAAL